MSLYDRILTEDQRPLAEGVKVGDYVHARDGRDGYADRVEGGMVYFVYKTYKKSENVVLPVEEVNVSTVEMRGQYADDMQRYANSASVAGKAIKKLLPKLRASIKSGDSKSALTTLDALEKKAKGL